MKDDGKTTNKRTKKPAPAIASLFFTKEQRQQKKLEEEQARQDAAKQKENEERERALQRAASERERRIQEEIMLTKQRNDEMLRSGRKSSGGPATNDAPRTKERWWEPNASLNKDRERSSRSLAQSSSVTVTAVDGQADRDVSCPLLCLWIRSLRLKRNHCTGVSCHSRRDETLQSVDFPRWRPQRRCCGRCRGDVRRSQSMRLTSNWAHNC